MSDKVFIGLRAASIETFPVMDPISKIILLVDDSNYYEAGDDTGRTVELNCPYGTQQMANDLLSSLGGYSYKPIRSTDAIWDPAAEIGDGVTINHTYTILAQTDTVFDSLLASDISAPSTGELESEYTYIPPIIANFDRKIAETYSLITKTAEEIRLEVRNDLEELSATFSVKIDSITSEIQGINGQVSTLQQTASSLTSRITNAEGDISLIEQTIDSITLEVSNSESSSTIRLMVDGIAVSSKTIEFTGEVVFKSDLEDGVTVISGDNITTGHVTAEFIKLGGQMEVYEDVNSTVLGGYLGYISHYDANGDPTEGVGLLDYSESNQVVVTNGGARMNSANAEVVVATNATISSHNYVTIEADMEIHMYSSGFTSDQPLTVTSDRNSKESILYDIEEKYLSVFDGLRPSSYLYKNKPPVRHWGFIAQDVQKALQAAGVTDNNFGPLALVDNKTYALRYEAFIPLLVAKIKQLEKEIQKWKN